MERRWKHILEACSAHLAPRHKIPASFYYQTFSHLTAGANERLATSCLCVRNGFVSSPHWVLLQPWGPKGLLGCSSLVFITFTKRHRVLRSRPCYWEENTKSLLWVGDTKTIKSICRIWDKENRNRETMFRAGGHLSCLYEVNSRGPWKTSYKGLSSLNLATHWDGLRSPVPLGKEQVVNLIWTS